MRRITVKMFKALALGSPGPEPLEVTSHGFLVGTWYPVGVKAIYASGTGEIVGHTAAEFRPVPKPGKR